VVVLPDSVTLEGPKSMIEKSADSINLKVVASRLGSNFRENVEVVIPNNELISRNPPVAEVIFEVGPVEELVKPIGLRIPKLPWGVEVREDSIQCVFVIPTKDHDQFMSDIKVLQARLKLPELRKGESVSLMPTLQGLPPYAELKHVDSVLVKKY